MLTCSECGNALVLLGPDVLDAVVEDEFNDLEAEADLDDHDEEDYNN